MISTKDFPALCQQLAESHQLQWKTRLSDQKLLRDALTAKHRKQRQTNTIPHTENAWNEMLNKQACEHIEPRAISYNENLRLFEQQKQDRADLKNAFYNSTFPFFMIGAFL